MGADDTDVEGGVGDDIGGCWGWDEGKRWRGEARGLACEGGGVDLPAPVRDISRVV